MYSAGDSAALWRRPGAIWPTAATPDSGVVELDGSFAKVAYGLVQAADGVAHLLSHIVIVDVVVHA
jgi:hypothetical protein